MATVTTEGTVGLGLKRVSASKLPDQNIKQADQLAILVDISSCIGCKACEAACSQWHDLKPPLHTEEKIFTGYQSGPGLAPNLFMYMRFQEVETPNGLVWAITKYQCMHCLDPGCLKACPSPGAIIQYANGVVDFDHSKCIGCKFCLAGCPFDVPRYDANNKPWKCNFCIDRISAGLEPMCVKTCPTNALHFGTKEEMLIRANKLLEGLKKRGFDKASIYDPKGVGGAGYIYLLPHGDKPEIYGLPKEASISPLISLWKGPIKLLGSIVLWGTLLGAFLQLILFGPIKVGKKHKKEE